ncbi:hypothetical protein SDC9_200238 [bioreactor metagenome]|uniref:Uncharacterized protein n=1 Tax=bioreactor metagenome TaxID=1076179 RepID=A0A645INC6_9ZZZZ
MGKTAFQLGLDDWLGILWKHRAEQRSEAFMQFGGDEIQPFHQSVTLQRASCRCQAFFWHTVSEVLNDGRPFGEHLPIIHLQSGDTAQGIDGLVINTSLSHLGAEINLF